MLFDLAPNNLPARIYWDTTIDFDVILPFALTYTMRTRPFAFATGVTLLECDVAEGLPGELHIERKWKESDVTFRLKQHSSGIHYYHP